MSEQVVILSGGKGTRLRPLTYNIPKPMAPVLGKPFLEHQLKLLSEYGFYRFLLCTGYLSHVIENYFGNGKKWGWEIDYSIEPAMLGTGGALKLAEAKLAERFILLNGDTLLFLDYRALWEEFTDYSIMGNIVIYSNELQIAPNNITMDNQGYITEYDKINRGNKKYIDAGVQIFRKEILQYIPEGKIVSLEMELFPILIKSRALKGWVTKERFYDIGTPEQLALLEETLK